MGWMHLIIFHRPSIRISIHDNEGHFQHFSKKIGFQTWRLSILRMPLHTNMLCEKLRVQEWLNQKSRGIHFLFLFKNDILFWKIAVVNFCRLITPQTHPGQWAWQVCRLWNFNCVWFVDPTFRESKSKVLLKLYCMKLLTLVWNYAVCSESR